MSPQINAEDVAAIKDGYDRLAPIVLRDYLAAQAMSALIAKAPLASDATINEAEAADRLLRTAHGAYLYADAMIAARSVCTPGWAKQAPAVQLDAARDAYRQIRMTAIPGGNGHLLVPDHAMGALRAALYPAGGAT